MTATLLWAIASAVISVVGGLVFREWQHRQQIKTLQGVIAAKKAETEAVKERIGEYGKVAAEAPVHDPDNIQL